MKKNLKNLRNLLLITGLIALILLLVARFAAPVPTTTPPAQPAANLTTSPPALPTVNENTAPNPHQTVLELFNPSDASLTHQHSEAALVQTLEQLVTTTFVLRRCSLIDDVDYARYFQAIHHYARQMQLTPTPAQTAQRMQQIITSASTSYALVYSRADCDAPSLKRTADQFIQWQQRVLGHADI